MLVSGMAILFFVIYHLLHYTFGIIQPNTYYAGGYRMESTGEIVHHVYNMVVAGFQNPFIALSYLIALAFMSSHVSHATSSAFQTLGVTNPNISKITSKIGPALAAIFLIGYTFNPNRRHDWRDKKSTSARAYARDVEGMSRWTKLHMRLNINFIQQDTYYNCDIP